MEQEFSGAVDGVELGVNILGLGPGMFLCCKGEPYEKFSPHCYELRLLQWNITEVSNWRYMASARKGLAASTVQIRIPERRNLPHVGIASGGGGGAQEGGGAALSVIQIMVILISKVIGPPVAGALPGNTRGQGHTSPPALARCVTHTSSLFSYSGIYILYYTQSTNFAWGTLFMDV